MSVLESDSKIDSKSESEFAAREIASRIASAAKERTPLILRGNGGKSFYGNPSAGEVLDLSSLRGILEYEPSELFVSAAAATPLSEIESLLRENGQMLAFEPPHFSSFATAGGAFACGLSGPRRPSAGALRDHILGIAIIDGRGRQLTFGGKVMKNVAGFDVSRMMAGAMGTLGVVAKIVFRASPIPECEATTVRECNAADAIAEDNRMLARGLPLTGGAWHNGKCWRRFSGGEKSLHRALQESGGDVLSQKEHADFWHSAREHRHPFFDGKENLWRIVASPSAPLFAEDEFVEWHGAIRWRRGTIESANAAANKIGGVATLFRAADPKQSKRFPLPPSVLQAVYKKLKNVFDPENILNRGRLYDFGE